ncbi:2-amino-4-hydroxy-6-hydroxymethyldihydropteridine diphosphokinase [Synergistaceae bacterium OttesenSCG-928-D05]|nr:2-amino-4-hydroxy-6-hydroxymethyldihydropteridine diphosphokinase [Synergistaceae bacterium OttesenSCG-928-D05]
MHSKKVAIALGSNKGNRLEMLRMAIKMLPKLGFTTTAASRVWETAPWGVLEQPRFLNMCILTESTLSPEEMLQNLKKIEYALGRKKTQQWGPREIDLDILLIDCEIVDSKDLHVPHLRMHERAFVLVPLAEIARDMVHPELNKTIGELLTSCAETDMDWITTI